MKTLRHESFCIYSNSDLLNIWALSIVRYSKECNISENWICFRPQGKGLEAHILPCPLESDDLSHSFICLHRTMDNVLNLRRWVSCTTVRTPQIRLEQLECIQFTLFFQKFWTTQGKCLRFFQRCHVVYFRKNVFTEPSLRNGRLFIRLLHSNGCTCYITYILCSPKKHFSNLSQKATRPQIILCTYQSTDNAHPSWFRVLLTPVFYRWSHKTL
jgi:hypothetical protein